MEDKARETYFPFSTSNTKIQATFCIGGSFTGVGWEWMIDSLRMKADDFWVRVGQTGFLPNFTCPTRRDGVFIASPADEPKSNPISRRLLQLLYIYWAEQPITNMWIILRGMRKNQRREQPIAQIHRFYGRCYSYYVCGIFTCVCTICLTIRTRQQQKLSDFELDLNFYLHARI